jgi:ATP phosphoribosyltransferase
VPVDAEPGALADLEGLRVATAYPVSTRKCLGGLGVSVELVPISGSVEAAPRLGLADAIVDLVSTGSTASVNGLRRIGQLLESEAVLLRGPRTASGKDEHVERLALMLQAVVAARRRRYVMMNAPAEALEEIRAVLPSMGAPSVLELADPGQIAVHAAIDADQVWDLLAPLKAAGATSILVVPVERLVP